MGCSCQKGRQAEARKEGAALPGIMDLAAPSCPPRLNAPQLHPTALPCPHHFAGTCCDMLAALAQADWQQTLQCMW